MMTGLTKIQYHVGAKHYDFWARNGTQDLMAFQEVMLENEYRLPEGFVEADTIIDVGAQIGTFAIACLERGAGKVVCYEPEPVNFSILQKNLIKYGKRAELHRSAVWRAGENIDLSISSEPFTAMHQTWPDELGTCPSEDLASIIAKHGPVRLCKLDCECAEYVILESTPSVVLRSVQEFAIELHPGYTAGDREYSPAFAAARLKEAGFDVELVKNARCAELFHCFASKARNLVHAS